MWVITEIMVIESQIDKMWLNCWKLKLNKKKTVSLNYGKGLEFIFSSSDPNESVDILNIFYQGEMVKLITKV